MFSLAGNRFGVKEGEFEVTGQCFVGESEVLTSLFNSGRQRDRLAVGEVTDVLLHRRLGTILDVSAGPVSNKAQHRKSDRAGG
ncbi:hypothetical protein AAFN60_21170 [Roseibacillus persicicus]|uniref:hypothetical protein n=1 Tax=Roseibacillus persicicus TaxID=454148 RepID=UPI00398B823B